MIWNIPSFLIPVFLIYLNLPGLISFYPLTSLGCPGGSEVKAHACVCLKHGRPGFDPWVGKIPWRTKWQLSPVFLPGESHGRRSLVGYNPQGRKESETTERLHFHLHFHPLTLNICLADFQPWLNPSAYLLCSFLQATRNILQYIWYPYTTFSLCFKKYIITTIPLVPTF